MLEEPPTNERLYVEVQSASSKLGLLHPKVMIILHHFHETRWNGFSTIYETRDPWFSSYLDPESNFSTSVFIHFPSLQLRMIISVF